MQQARTSRMEKLIRMLQREPDDPFLHYGLALEYKKLGDPWRAIEHLHRVIELDPGYCYAYHQRGLILESLGETESAKRSYRAGIEAAIKKGDDHARSEIEGALSLLE